MTATVWCLRPQGNTIQKPKEAPLPDHGGSLERGECGPSPQSQVPQAPAGGSGESGKVPSGTNPDSPNHKSQKHPPVQEGIECRNTYTWMKKNHFALSKSEHVAFPLCVPPELRVCATSKNHNTFMSHDGCCKYLEISFTLHLL